jgi:GAF domain-containing protein
MSNNLIRCGLLGGREKDLYVLGELQKRREIEIAYVYDRDPSAVGLEIAEILGLPRLNDPAALAQQPPVDYVIVAEPRTQFADELGGLAESGARVIGPGEALQALCGREAPPHAAVPTEGPDEAYSIEDALAAFERLFDREQLLKFLLDVGVQATGASAGSIMMYSSEAGELYIAYAIGLSERVMRRTRQKLGEGVAGLVAKERRGRLIRESPKQARYTSDRDRLDIESAVSVPLVHGDRLMGVLNVSSSQGGKPLTAADLSTLERLSARISRVLYESARLQETQVRHHEMDLRQSMGQLTETAASPTAKFSMISNLLADLVGADTVEMYVGTHEGDWLVLGGSNRRASQQPDMIRCEKGALSRCYLERRTVVLTETAGHPDDDSVASFVFVPLHLKDTLGVLVVEFGERPRLDDFLVIKDSVALEMARFLASERRERRLRRELEALAKVSDAAPLLLTCRSLDELCEYLARLVADALSCTRTSVRLLGSGDAPGKLARYEDADGHSEAWAEEDEERFLKLRKKGKPFALAFLDFDPEAADATPAYHALMAVPIEVDGQFAGGLIAYDKRPEGAFDEATFSDLDEAIVAQIVSIATPVIRSLAAATPAAQATEPSYDAVLSGNVQRLRRVMAREMSRSDRYHHPFSLLVLKIKPLAGLFDSDADRALTVVDEITRGIQTRTRKTDYGTWIRRDTFAMVSLEGTRRIRFLVSRLMLYLLKDFASAGGMSVAPVDVLIGHAIYPGTARTPEALLKEVEDGLEPYGAE